MQGINFKDRKLHQTDDGSFTLAINSGSETYHSRRGALSESQHVYVDMGFRAIVGSANVVRVLEVGFGTGLNALLTLRTLLADFSTAHLQYTALEPRPLHIHEVAALNYFTENECKWLEGFHTVAYKGGYAPIPQFELTCKQVTLSEFVCEECAFDLVYYDAFGPATQPELWNKASFTRIARLLRSGGALVTYCAKGQVRRDLESVGFQAERLDGPPGKREMLRAWKK
jgi:tRNA U34 5-methylaminomethyl-2-thiouridine-forming methyltransferase MnmC